MRPSIKLVYALSGLFIATGLMAVFFEAWYFFLLPVLLMVLYAYVYKPIALIYLLALATPLSIQITGEGSGFTLSIPTEPLIILLLIGLFYKFIISRNLNFRVFEITLSLLITADLLWMILTGMSSTMPFISFKFILSKIWYVAIFYFLLVKLFDKPHRVKIFLWCLMISSVFLAIYTLYNHSEGSFSRSYAYTAMRPFMPDHGMYAAALSFFVPVAFIFFFYGNQLKLSLTLRLVALAFFILLTLAVGLSFTRAAWISLAAAFGVLAALVSGIRLKYLLLISGLAGILLLSNFDQILTDLSRNKSESDDNIEEHLQSVSNVTSDPSNLERLNRWSCAVRMFKDKPLMGFGPGTYTFQYGVYQLPHEMTIISTNAGTLGNVHSEYFRPLVESGILGFVFFAGIVLASLFMGFHQYRNLSGERKYLSLAVFLGLITYFAHGFLNNYAEFDKIAVPLYGFLAVLAANQLWLRTKPDEIRRSQEITEDQ